MANLEKTVSIIFSGKDENLSATIDKIGDNFSKMNSSLGGMTSPFAAVTDDILKLDTVLAALAIGGITYAVKTAGELEESFDQVALRIRGSESDIETFKGQVEAYGMSSSRSLKDINEALAESIQKGTDYKVALEGLSIAEQLAVATHSDLKSSSVLLTTVMNSYGASLDQASHYGDVFTRGVQIGAGTLPELSTEMGKVAGIASGMNIPIETLVAALGALGSYGVDSATALGGLKFMLGNMLKPSSDAQKEAAKLGIAFDAQTVSTKGLETVLKQAYTATHGNAEAMKILFGSVRGLNVAFDLAKDSTGAFRNDLELTRNSTGLMKKEYDLFVNDFENVNQRMENSFKQTIGDIGNKLMPSYSNIANSLADVFKGLKIGIDAGAFDPIFNFLTEMGKELASKLEIIAKNLPEAMKGLNFSGLINSLKGLGGALGDAFTALFGKFDLMTSSGLHDFIQKIIDSFKTLIEVTKGIVEGFEPLLKGIGKFVDDCIGADSKTKEFAGNILGLATSINTLSEHMGIVKGVFAIFTGAALIDCITGVKALAGAADVALIPALQRMAAVCMEFMLSPAGLVAMGVAMAGFTAYAIIQKGTLDNLADSHNANAKALNQSTLAMLDAGLASGKLTQAQHDHLIQSLGLVDGIQKVQEATEKNTDAMGNSIPTYQQVIDQIKATRTNLDGMNDKKVITIGVQADGSTIDKVGNILIEKFPDDRTMTITNIVNGVALKNVSDTIEKEIPKEKTMEIMAKIDEVKIKEQSAIIQKSVEWKAKVDIAQIESAAKIIETAFKSVDATIADTGKVITADLGVFATLTQAGRGGTAFMEQQITDENRRRDAALELEKKLVEAQVDNMKARTNAMQSGQAMIQIDGKGLQPQLEAFMFEVLKAIQIRANAEGAQYLVGM
jgi:TP901 family phage tail tape measure protein